MFKTKYLTDESMLINTESLQRITGLGRGSAVRLGIEAGARVEIGRRVLWHRKKVLKHIDDLAGREN